MLRRAARPTETDLQFQYSHMINEALEMAGVETQTLPSSSRSFLPSLHDVPVPSLRDAPGLPRPFEGA